MSDRRWGKLATFAERYGGQFELRMLVDGVVPREGTAESDGSFAQRMRRARGVLDAPRPISRPLDGRLGRLDG
jgi:hypothetical protein